MFGKVFSRRDRREKSKSFEAEFLPFMDAAYTLAVYLTNDRTTAQDMVQDAYLRAFKAYKNYEDNGTAKAWFLTIVRNCCYGYITKRNNPKTPLTGTGFDTNGEMVVSLFSEGTSLSPEEQIIAKQSGAAVHNAIGQLPPLFREVILLREIEGMSYAEIANVTGAPSGTVMSRLSRARAQLQTILITKNNKDTRHGL